MPTPQAEESFLATLSLSVSSSSSLRLVPSTDMTDGSPCLKQMVFGVVTAVDLLNFVTGRERRERSMSESTDELN